MRWLVLATLLIGCGTGGDAPAPGPAPAAEDPQAAAAARVYGAQCASCHGARGRGDGAMAIQLSPRPRDYTDPAWQASITDDAIADIIVRGGAALGKSGAMPQHPDLGQKPEVLRALVALIRSFR
jgi:mono/diheme cytochrome c family protein